MAGTSALLTLTADDSIDSIIDQVRKAGAPYVEILAPQGTAALLSRKSCDKLREQAQRAGIDLMIFSPDEKIIKSAQTCQINAVAVDIQALAPAAAAPRPAAPAPPPAAGNPDLDFLASLEEVPAAPPPPAAAPRGLEQIRQEQPQFTDEEDNWAAALDSLSIASIGGEDALRAHAASSGNADDDAWANAFNDLSDTLSGDERAVAAPRQRVRPEDIQLTEDDLGRIDSKTKGKKGKTKSKTKSKTKGKDQTARRGTAGLDLGADPGLEREVAARNRTRRNVLIGAALVLALAALAIYWFALRGSQATIQVRLPASDVTATTYDDLLIIYSSSPVTATSSGVQARVIEVPVTVTVRGTVLTPTTQPDKSAAGMVQVYNKLPQEFAIPSGTRFNSVNPAGESVSYFSTADVTVPAASVDLTGSRNGVADIPVTAVGGGERFNLPGSDAGNWLIEGFEGSLIAINPQAIAGGTNILLKLPTDADIRQLLTQAIPQFENNVPQAMISQLQPGESVGGGGFDPDIKALAEHPELYTTETREIPDTDGGFELLVTATFRGLAVPGESFSSQFDRALRQALVLRGVDPETVRIEGEPTWRLSDDPNTNMIVASVTVAPQTSSELPAATVEQIKQLVAGKTPAEARAALQQLLEDGKIGPVVSFPDDLPQLPAAEGIRIEVAQ
ncbi:MAG TPA: hypothetical protein VGE07_18990 [Herpetosiphonaceae bacterium]